MLSLEAACHKDIKQCVGVSLFYYKMTDGGHGKVIDVLYLDDVLYLLDRVK